MQVDINYPWLVFDIDSDREPTVFSFATHKAAAKHINGLIKAQLDDDDDGEYELIDENDENSRNAFINEPRYGAAWLEYYIVNVIEQQTLP